MFIDFRVSNFRSIGEQQILSLLPATNQKEYQDNIFRQGNIEALNVTAIYGANASGKSNLLRSIGIFRSIIRKSAKYASTDLLEYDPFLLREGWAHKPTTFEINFNIENIRYRFGFSYSRSEIVEEWLFRKTTGREVTVFKRRGEVIDPTSTLKGNAKIIDAAIEATRGNSLFLSTLDVFNIQEATTIMKYFSALLIVDGNHTSMLGNLEVIWENEPVKNLVTDHLKRLQLGFDEVEARKDENAQQAQNQYEVIARHKVYDNKGNPTNDHISWNYLERESSGSVKALELSGPITLILETGGVLIIDEIEAKMHPLLTLDTINLFLNKETNPKNAQLIFSTHDTNLLSYAKLRRDQIYFAEKNSWQSTEIYSLSDFVYVDEMSGSQSKERPDTDKEKRYIEGRYGAVPVFGTFDKLRRPENG